MSDLREKMLPVLIDVADGDLTYRAATDRILALIPEALLSDDAVDALYEVIDNSMEPSFLQDAVRAQLAAAGITTKEQHDEQ